MSTIQDKEGMSVFYVTETPTFHAAHETKVYYKTTLQHIENKIIILIKVIHVQCPSSWSQEGMKVT